SGGRRRGGRRRGGRHDRPGMRPGRGPAADARGHRARSGGELHGPAGEPGGGIPRHPAAGGVPMSAPHRRRERGVVLVLVLFYVLLLAATIATLQRRVAIDAGIAVNRDRAAAAEALARGGVRLAEALLLEDLRLEGGEGAVDSRWDVWARAGLAPLFVDEDGEQSLIVEIEDSGARLNLNALAGAGGIGRGDAPPEALDNVDDPDAPPPPDTGRRRQRQRPRSRLGGDANGV